MISEAVYAGRAEGVGDSCERMSCDTAVSVPIINVVVIEGVPYAL